MTNTILQIVKVDPECIDAIKPTFNELPETDHVDGNYRLRRYSHVAVTGKDIPSITDLHVKQFTQSSKYNQHQGGMERNFQGVSIDTLHSAGMRELARSFRDVCSFEDNFTMDIHQMRVICKGGATQLSPEGWHQDGYDCVGMIGIDRQNIIGGEVLLSTHKTEPPFLQAIMDTGTMVVIDDSHLWHNGRSIQPINNDDPAYMDIIVFTARK